MARDIYGFGGGIAPTQPITSILDFREAVTDVPVNYVPPEVVIEPEIEEAKPAYTMADCQYSTEERTLQAMRNGIILPANAEYCLIEKFGNSGLEASDKVREGIGDDVTPIKVLEDVPTQEEAEERQEQEEGGGGAGFVAGEFALVGLVAMLLLLKVMMRGAQDGN